MVLGALIATAGYMQASCRLPPSVWLPIAVLTRTHARECKWSTGVPRRGGRLQESGTRERRLGACPLVHQEQRGGLCCVVCDPIPAGDRARALPDVLPARRRALLDAHGTSPRWRARDSATWHWCQQFQWSTLRSCNAHTPHIHICSRCVFVVLLFS